MALNDSPAVYHGETNLLTRPWFYTQDMIVGFGVVWETEYS